MYRWGKNGGGKGDRLRRIPRSERKSRDRVLINLSIVLAKLRGERREPTRTAFQNFFSPQKFSQGEWKAIDPIRDPWYYHFDFPGIKPWIQRAIFSISISVEEEKGTWNSIGAHRTP